METCEAEKKHIKAYKSCSYVTYCCTLPLLIVIHYQLASADFKLIKPFRCVPFIYLETIANSCYTCWDYISIWDYRPFHPPFNYIVTDNNNYILAHFCYIATGQYICKHVCLYCSIVCTHLSVMDYKFKSGYLFT